MKHECNKLKKYLMVANRFHNSSYWFRIWLCDLLVVLVLAFMHNSKDPIHNHSYYCFFFNFRGQTPTNYINLFLEWTCMHTEVYIIFITRKLTWKRFPWLILPSVWKHSYMFKMFKSYVFHFTSYPESSQILDFFFLNC